jgi:transposase-like protein
MPRTRHTAEEKFAILEELRHSGIGMSTFSKQCGVNRTTLKSWQDLYARDGLEGLQRPPRSKRYTALLKHAAVLAYQAGEGSLADLTIRFGLRSSKQLRDWISRYNGEKPLTASPSRKQVPTMSRKTTFEERIEVVEYVTKDKHSYAEAAEHFQISYQQARSWVLKAKDGGYEALTDNRGHRKTEVNLSETDKLKLEVRQLKAELRDKELIEAFAKKLLELQHKG